MAYENLAPDERDAVLKLLRDTIAADRFPLSPRIRTLRSALAKLDPNSRAVSAGEGLGQQQHRPTEAAEMSLLGNPIRRRQVLALGGGITIWPFIARGQEPGRVYHVGLAAPTAADAPQWHAVLDELDRGGFVEGKNLVIDRRGLGANSDRMDAIVAELIGNSPDLLYCGGDAAIHAAFEATKKIPVVATADDYLATGVVGSLANPGGNFTGVSLFAPELNGKRIELLIEMLPGVHRIAVLADRKVTQLKNLEAVETAVQARGIDLSLYWIAHEHEIAPALRAAQAGGAQAVTVLSSPLLHSVHPRIIKILAGAQLPGIFQWPEYASEGALAAYGPRLLTVFRQVGDIMVKVLRGAKPADLPIEQPTKFELVINLKTAKTMGLTVPPALLARADEVIE